MAKYWGTPIFHPKFFFFQNELLEMNFKHNFSQYNNVTFVTFFFEGFP